jgi:tetratricopeptide (TPR) repeat protein
VVVVNAHADPSQPVQGVRVSLSFVAGAEKVVDSRDATNRSGQALLLVSPEAVQRGNLRIEITGVSDLVVYLPADGQLNGLPSTVTVQLLPKGSILLLRAPQIEAMLQRLSLQNNAKSQQIRALKGELAAAQSSRPDDLTAAMTEWGRANGFEAADVDTQVHQWADNIQRRKDQATVGQRALAELALKHYGEAAQDFDKRADDAGQSLDSLDKDDEEFARRVKEHEQKALDDRHKQMVEYVDAKLQSSNAYQLNLQYHLATQVLDQARDRAAAEHTKYPEDAALRSIWLDAIGRAAEARVAEGEIAKAADSPLLLSRSIDDFQTLIHAYTAPEERQNWAATQNDLGSALQGQAERASGAPATDLLAQAVEAFHAALQVRTRADQPEVWALIQNNLGVVLWDQGKTSLGKRANDPLAQAVAAFQAALQVCTKAGQPELWATIQGNLGNALSDQGERGSGDLGTDALVRAVAAFRAALEVRSKANLPEDWATTQINLGTALVMQADRTDGAPGTDLLAQSVQAYRSALEVLTQANLPQDWAAAQGNLGVALRDQGERSSGAQATDLFAQSVEAFRSALEVFSKAGLPQGWAAAQSNLGRTLVDQGTRSSGAQATDLLAQAVLAYRSALQVDTKTDMTRDWEATQINLGLALTAQGERSSGAQAADLFAQAVKAYQAGLEVDTRSEFPLGWAKIQDSLGTALRDESQTQTGNAAAALLDQAVQAFQNALQVYTKADQPEERAIIQTNLGEARTFQGDFVAAAAAFDSALEVFPDVPELLQFAASIDHDKLFRFDRAFELDERRLKSDSSPGVRMEFIEASLTAAHFSQCAEQAAAIDDPVLSTSLIPVRDTIKLACQWGAGQKAAAQQTATALLPQAAGLHSPGWNFAGTRHFLTSSAAFETDRASWIALFESLEKGDGAAMAAALHQLDAVMNH